MEIQNLDTNHESRPIKSNPHLQLAHIKAATSSIFLHHQPFYSFSKQLGSIFTEIIDKNAGCTYKFIKSIVHGQTGLHKCL